jgi:hypothetical protein
MIRTLLRFSVAWLVAVLLSSTAPGEEASSFAGEWETTFGRMTLQAEGEKITGTYRIGDGPAHQLQGRAGTGVLDFSYTEGQITGEGSFTLAEDGKSFTGKWREAGDEEWSPWEGSRVQPDQRRKWLVVLEAHWEEDLRENEYSFGDMLRQFFTRIPEVGVRHRFFDEHEDFARWCAELAYLNEPIVLHISSHGTEQGITVGKHVLDGKFIGEQLRDCPHVKLVHLGACLTMAGPVPQDIRQASGYGFPVSGYTRSADWAGSAVIDFTYLDLIFSRDIKPGEAAGIVQKSISFSGESKSHQGDIPPTGLKILE